MTVIKKSFVIYKETQNKDSSFFKEMKKKLNHSNLLTYEYFQDEINYYIFSENVNHNLTLECIPMNTNKLNKNNSAD